MCELTMLGIKINEVEILSKDLKKIKVIKWWETKSSRHTEEIIFNDGKKITLINVSYNDIKEHIKFLNRFVDLRGKVSNNGNI